MSGSDRVFSDAAIERAARAIHAVQFIDPRHPMSEWDGLSDAGRAHYLREARAALDAAFQGLGNSPLVDGLVIADAVMRERPDDPLPVSPYTHAGSAQMEGEPVPPGVLAPVSPKAREWTLEPSAEENVRASACHACVIKSVTGPLLVPGERVRVREVLEEDK